MTNHTTQENNEISLTEIVQKLGKWWIVLKNQWIKVFIFGIIGGLIGFGYAYKQSDVYIAKITFVVEEGKSTSSNFGGLASLAGQFGVDFGGGGGLFSGENILLYFKSNSLAREVLLSNFDSSSNESIADRYSSVYNLKETWEKNKKIGNVSFPVSNNDNNIFFTRLQDSLLQTIIYKILNTQFSVEKIDKKAGFIEVTINMQNELLAKVYVERIVQRAVDKYIKNKTQRQKITVDKLQFRVDSLANLLKQKTLSGASLQTSSNTIDINPLFKTNSNVAIETTMRDKTMLSTIFASVVQNLELAKFTLSQETPVIQIVDSPILPLRQIKTSKLYMIIVFSLGFIGITTIFIIITTIVKNNLSPKYQ